MRGLRARRCSRRGPSQQLSFTIVESDKRGHLAAGVFAIDLDQTAYEKVLLFRGPCMPIIGLSHGDHKSEIESPLLLLLF